MNYIDEQEDLKGVRVLLRLDLNVPVKDGQVVDPYRLEKSIEMIDFLREKQAQTIIIAHCEGKVASSATRRGGGEPTSLVPMWHYLNGLFPIEFSENFFTPEAIDKINKLEDRGVLMFENLRINEGEKDNDEDFAKKLAQVADIYVNDAFSVSHRKHASIIGVPKFLPHYAGILMRKEMENLSKIFDPKRPFLFILGGAKFDTKLPLIKKYLEKADKVFVGGALSNNVYKTKGLEIGKSMVSDGDFGIEDMIKNPKFIVPIDITVVEEGGEVKFKKPEEVLATDKINDCGPETIKMLKDEINNSKTVVWNGPLGDYEIGFSDKTEQLAEILAEATANGVESIIGGGDTLASIQKLGLEEKFTFVSTGGGAMLDFLVNETLPGIEALTK